MGVNAVKLSPPWDIYVLEVKALFCNDPQITIEYDEDNLNLKLYVDDDEKYKALSRLIPNKKVFGNVTLNIFIIPANAKHDEHENILEVITAAFKGNPIFKGVYSGGPTSTYPFNYVVFAKEVVQIYTDDLTDVNGYKSTLYENIAPDVLENVDRTIYYCTDIR